MWLRRELSRGAEVGVGWRPTAEYQTLARRGPAMGFWIAPIFAESSGSSGRNPGWSRRCPLSTHMAGPPLDGRSVSRRIAHGRRRESRQRLALRRVSISVNARWNRWARAPGTSRGAAQRQSLMSAGSTMRDRGHAGRRALGHVAHVDGHDRQSRTRAAFFTIIG